MKFEAPEVIEAAQYLLGLSVPINVPAVPPVGASNTSARTVTVAPTVAPVIGLTKAKGFNDPFPIGKV